MLWSVAWPGLAWRAFVRAFVCLSGVTYRAVPLCWGPSMYTTTTRHQQVESQRMETTASNISMELESARLQHTVLEKSLGAAGRLATARDGEIKALNSELEIEKRAVQALRAELKTGEDRFEVMHDEGYGQGHGPGHGQSQVWGCGQGQAYG